MPSLFANRRHPVEQLHQLGDVVAVGRGQRPGERQAAAVYEEVVLAARAAAVDRAGTGLRAPFSPAGSSSRPLRATTRADRPRATRRATTRAASPRPRPAARRATCARRSSRNRSRTPAAGAPSRSPCAARTRSLQRQAIVERLPTRIAKTTRSVRQQRQDPLPERIRDLPRLRPDRHPSRARRRRPTDFATAERVPSFS